VDIAYLALLAALVASSAAYMMLCSALEDRP
jgi:hypothetical protein